MLFSVPSFLGGLGVLNRRFWARVVVIVLGFLSLAGALASFVGQQWIGGVVNLAYAAFVLAVLLHPRCGAEFR